MMASEPLAPVDDLLISDVDTDEEANVEGRMTSDLRGDSEREERQGQD